MPDNTTIDKKLRTIHCDFCENNISCDGISIEIKDLKRIILDEVLSLIGEDEVLLSPPDGWNYSDKEVRIVTIENKLRKELRKKAKARLGE